ncbi:CDP-diacylglycerol--glycerol-3-phosphate 3-phosphatidyltransferase [mine drainage metagenome]|uniref:CDP-diacylglycerol--glycerol-3-phosphate 3-phosphatidyltransferase n=1 Tax=mine drainage metagenome TaxID=410659 RepID=T1BW81_9ZZZZ
MKLPNFLTALRIGLVPAFVLIFWMPDVSAHVWAGLIFAIAGLTDWLDGYLARRLEQGSRFGVLFDPIADKMMVSAALLLLIQELPYWWLVLPALIIIGREITVSGLREWLAGGEGKGKLPVKWLGKLKTSVQMVAIFCLLISIPGWTSIGLPFGLFLLYMAALLTVLSGLEYLRQAWPSIRQGM